MLDATARAVAPPETRKRTRRGGGHYLVALLLGFALAAASFIGSTLYADSRLEQVARQSHDVSDQAMPSVVHLSAMRRELSRAVRVLYASATGDSARLRELRAHVLDLDEARSSYELLPSFPGEAPAWAAAAAKVDLAERAIPPIVREIESGQGTAATADIREVLEPAVLAADDALAGIVRLNYGEGALAAANADSAWSHARRLGLTLDGVSLAITAALAFVAFRSTRHHAIVLKKRADELETFALRVAHDLRGPLMPALVALERAAIDPGACEATRKTVDRGIRSLARVDGLVQDLLAFARAAAEPEPGASASLRRVVYEVMQDVEPQATAARVRVGVTDLPACRVLCAPGVLASIVHNLVCNAVKHMPCDATERVVTLRANCSRCTVLVEVADSGAGVSAELRPHLFEPYVRGDRQCPGLGLGLATVRRLVEAHHGTVGCQSPRCGAGAVFWFELPALPPAADDEGTGHVEVA